ncbi:hypothetical protein J3T78_02345 [Staphylococcus nepalensis]|uniref:HK97 gp10 family phage protein n=1 Tax=Staphylococcus nepalensis TaxID=214473 RepID=A0ABS3L3U3_9STAP|nr:HK97-gp10 family putative phage morphogenesis protein [Staphylococcus nepalensis]MBO1214085.1 hypothetical protein [Staphylococcus nepalensis]MBO1217421.1 hypothetical protein [Staphylococcus nepalensis]MBO1228231.1 hypothetical protein [Staphylococcus nepalensis]MBO1233763.1 hypothetical protein [Staphylococcus nepalensis]MBO1236547.1 hypothetical protein [Staphylococcus nepalensis]
MAIYDSDAEISRKIFALVAKSEREAKKAVTQVANMYEGTLINNTPHDTGKAVSTVKQSNFKSGLTLPQKEVGYKSWYIHFPEVGTKVFGKVRQPPQHFQAKTMEQVRKPALNVYKQAIGRVLK